MLHKNRAASGGSLNLDTVTYVQNMLNRMSRDPILNLFYCEIRYLVLLDVDIIESYKIQKVNCCRAKLNDAYRKLFVDEI